MLFTRNTQPAHFDINRGSGAYFIAPDGSPVLDFCSQTLNLSLGQCHPAVNRAISEALAKTSFVSSRFGNEYVRALAERVAAVAPPGLSRLSLKVTSGSLANEGVLKAAYKLRGTTGTVALLGSHHGQSLGTMRVSGKHFDLSYLDRSGVHFVEPCTCTFRSRGGDAASECSGECVARMRAVLDRHHPDVAAVILEPVMVDAGVIVLPRNYVQEIAALARGYGIPLLFDEVQTAFGWTGHMFAADYLGVVPDGLTACKGFAAGYPLSLILVTEALDVLEYGEHEITHGAHPLSCAAALATVETLVETDLLAQVRANGAYLFARLEALRREHPVVTDVRGIGYVMGVQLEDSPGGVVTRIIMDHCLKAGLLLRVSKVGERSNVLQFKPPLVTTRESLDQAVSIFSDALLEVERQRSAVIPVPSVPSPDGPAVGSV